ncbi:MAG: DUF4932 domain-containing protein [archaeon GB-1867-035]|nr:DUF4932 domain-containing protein [Candidatus Culexmicrobium profundum]
MSKQISVSLDPRIELLSALLLLSYWKEHGICREDYCYKKDAISYFKPYGDHQAVKVLEKALKYGLAGDAIVGLMMHLTKPPHLTLKVPLSKYYLERARLLGGMNFIRELVSALKDFYEATDFESFWNSNLSFYRRVEEKAKFSLRSEEVVRKLEDYFGISYDFYHIVLAPLFGGNYGCFLKLEGKTHFYAFLGPVKIEEDLPYFDKYVLLHEFMHGFVNPVTEKFREAFRNKDYILKPIAEFMIDVGYTRWETVVNETVIRACSIRIMKEQSLWDRVLSREESRGFVFIRPVFELLAEYEINRDRYRTFEDFYPRIVNLFNTLTYVLRALEKLKKYTFRGPMGVTLLFKDYLEKLTIITPSRIKDEKLKKRLHDHIMHIKSLIESRFKTNVQAIRDVDALNSDLSNRALMIFGTPYSNLLLAKLMPKLPFIISGDTIKLGEKTYKGKDLALITLFYNPWNKQLPMLIYTGTRDENIFDLPLVQEGDFAVYRRDKLIIQGRYLKKEYWEV